MDASLRWHNTWIRTWLGTVREDLRVRRESADLSNVPKRIHSMVCRAPIHFLEQHLFYSVNACWVKTLKRRSATSFCAKLRATRQQFAWSRAHTLRARVITAAHEAGGLFVTLIYLCGEILIESLARYERTKWWSRKSSAFTVDCNDFGLVYTERPNDHFEFSVQLPGNVFNWVQTFVWPETVLRL